MSIFAKEKIMRILLLIRAVLMLSSCGYIAPVEMPSGPGFFIGLFHGLISFFTMILSFFTGIEMYASNNSGSWYDLGFVIGAMIFYGGGAKSR